MPANAPPQQASWVGELFYQLSLAFSKVSILLLYVRVLHAYPLARRAAYAMLAIVVVYNVWGLYETATLCAPLAAYWDPDVKGDCKPIAYMWAAIGLHVATDFLIFSIPIPVVLRMRMPWRQKAELAMVFALGFLCVPPLSY